MPTRRMTVRRFLATVAMIVPLALAGCSSSADVPWPTDAWQRLPAKEAAAFHESLAPMYAEIEDDGLPFESVVIVQHGLLADESYPNGAADGPTALFSATKSINSLLMGIAIDEGYVSGEAEPVLAFFGERTVRNPSPLKDAMTIENVLTMSCGMEWDESGAAYADPTSAYNEWVATDDRVGYVLDLPMREEPGLSYAYNTPASQLVPAIIQESTGTSTLDFAFEHLFGPLGISSEDVIWKTDPTGVNRVGGLNMRPLDMAKIGLLVLNRGAWDGTQLVPAEWIEKSTSPAFAIENGVSIGYHWYIHEADGLLFYSAQGYGDQAIYVIPDLDAVVVFTGYNIDSAPRSAYLLRAYVIPALTG